MTPQRKRLHALLLEEAMHNARMAFNHRFLSLRTIKRKVTDRVVLQYKGFMDPQLRVTYATT
jgi:hypothetical protein